jgi:hypothetical protein
MLFDNTIYQQLSTLVKLARYSNKTFPYSSRNAFQPFQPGFQVELDELYRMVVLDFQYPQTIRAKTVKYWFSTMGIVTPTY